MTVLAYDYTELVEPNLLSGKKPLGPVELNHDNRYVPYLKFCTLLGQASPVDLVSGSLGSLATGVRPAGKPTSGESAQYTDAGGAWSFPGFTIEAVPTILLARFKNVDETTGNSNILLRAYSSFKKELKLIRGAGADVISGNIDFNINVAVLSATTTTRGVDRFFTVALLAKPGIGAELCIDGVQEASHSTNIGTTAWDASTIHVFSDHAGANIWEGYGSFAMILQGAHLTGEDCIRLSRDPYQVVRSRQIRFLGTADAVGGFFARRYYDQHLGAA